MEHKIFSTDWNIVVNCGIKCNTLPLSRRANIRYYSSPFDNMDSVEGWVEIGKLIANRFNGYFDDYSSWKLRNDYAARSTDIRAKIAWHELYPNLYYPHFYHRWIENIDESSLANWINDPNGKLDFVWDGFRKTFNTRQQRLLDIIDNNNSVLFLRVEDRQSLRRTLKRDFEEDTHVFYKHITNAFPNLKFSVAYFYCDAVELTITPESTENIYFNKIPIDVDIADYVVDVLSHIKLLPREELRLSNISKDI